MKDLIIIEDNIDAENKTVELTDRIIAHQNYGTIENLEEAYALVSAIRIYLGAELKRLKSQ